MFLQILKMRIRNLQYRPSKQSYKMFIIWICSFNKHKTKLQAALIEPDRHNLRAYAHLFTQRMCSDNFPI